MKKTIDELQAEAGAKTHHKVQKMIEEKFGVKGKGSSPSKKTKSALNKLRHKLNS